jgi:hypothetical protein
VHGLNDPRPLWFARLVDLPGRKFPQGALDGITLLTDQQEATIDQGRRVKVEREV